MPMFLRNLFLKPFVQFWSGFSQHRHFFTALGLFSDETLYVASHPSIVPQPPHFTFIIKNKLYLELSKPTERLFFFQLTTELQVWRRVLFQPHPISLMTPGEHCSDSRLGWRKSFWAAIKDHALLISPKRTSLGLIITSRDFLMQ